MTEKKKKKREKDVKVMIKKSHILHECLGSSLHKVAPFVAINTFGKIECLKRSAGGTLIEEAGRVTVGTPPARR